MARKSYVAVEDRNPFGEDFDEALLNDPSIDSTYIEGYSDVRRNRELALRDGETAPPLKHRLQWARAKTFDGQHLDGRRMMHWQTKNGYRPLPYDEAVKLGYDVRTNPAITKGEDGLAYLDSRVLVFTDGKRAATNLKRLQEDAAELAARPQRRMEEAVERFNRNTKGAHATAFSFLGDDDPDDIAKGKR